MAGIWTCIVPRRWLHDFNMQTMLEWIYGNLKKDEVIDKTPWSMIFAIAIWWAWKWRCGNTFGVNGRCRDRVRFIKELTTEVAAANSNQEGSSTKVVREERLIGWVPPNEGWLKLNTDGASHGNPGLATAGGALRDVDGNWCGGFAVNIGLCSAPMAELWGVYYGLYIA